MSEQRHTLDYPVWAALNGPQESIAEIRGLARRYPVDISPFAAIADQTNPQCWRDLAELIGPDGTAVLMGKKVDVPSDWEIVTGGTGKQMTGENAIAQIDDDLVELGSDDVPEMLELISLTQPGPFMPRTVELGGYLGLRMDGKLIAMAGRRMHPPGWVEISAVCTDPEYQGRGIGGRLVKAVAAGIIAQGEVPFLHVSEVKDHAIRLYETLGFRVRIQSTFVVLRKR